MKEYIRSGGDITVVVASDKEAKVQPVREAFQKVLGRATIYGIPAKVSKIYPVKFKMWRRL
jgi:non-canonical (house-cleaning) NTP pyrophosphatase